MGVADEPAFEAPVLSDFNQVADLSNYSQLPDDWIIGIADIVNSTPIVDEGGYKTVNFVGAATISAVTNALGENLKLFTFGGDGAHFAIPPEQGQKARQALKSVSHWAARNFGLELRVGMISMLDLRNAGHNVIVALVQTSPNVQYAMFSGGGIEWAERQLKQNKIRLNVSPEEAEPDLSGLSCQWGPVKPRQGVIVSLLVKQAETATQQEFETALSQILASLDNGKGMNPVQPDGPPVRLPTRAIGLQAATVAANGSWFRRHLKASLTALVAWLVFRFNLPVKNFDPQRYRREMAENSDFRKFSDGLMMTMDCTPKALAALESTLEQASHQGRINYGLHVQDEALITCVVPSIHQGNHVHFIDGADGGYVRAANALKSGLGKPPVGPG